LPLRTPRDINLIPIRRNRPMERTLIILKPDAVQRNLVGEILSRFEK
jgi:hypothetical protein